MTGIGIYSQSLVTSLKNAAGPAVSVSQVPVSSIGKRFRPIHRLRYFWRLRRFLRRNTSHGDIIHFTNVYVPAKVAGIKYVVTIHDLDPLILSSMHSPQYALYFQYIIRRSIERADLVLTDTESVREELIDRFDLNSMKVKNLGVGISTEFTAAADAAPRVALSKPTFLFVGQLNKKKNVRWLIETVRAGITEGKLPDIRLILAGAPGFGFEEIEDVLKQRNKEDIQWINRPNLPELVGLYRSCTAVIVPSLREGFGIPLLEAMYCGCKIIASDIPTNREVAGTAAEYFSLNDAESLYGSIHSVLRSTDDTSREISAREQLKKYNWNDLALQCLSFYQDMSDNVKK